MRRETGPRRRHVRDFESDENVHARARQVRGRRETTGGSGKLRKELAE